jgi:hypothetical protein
MNRHRKSLLVSKFSSLLVLFIGMVLLSGTGWAQSHTIYSNNFGMQCGTGESTNCPNYQLPTTQAQPGTFRLWGSGTYWGTLQPQNFTNCNDIQQVGGVNTYCWDHLDSWLDAIAGHSTIKAVDFTFGGVPCQIATSCVTHQDDPNGSSYPPTDLNSNGSVYFNNFVTNLVAHCSSAGNCVKSIIKYYEMWNEANLTGQWAGTETQLEDMVFPARNIIWSNVSNGFVLTPSTSYYNSDYSTWFQDWLDAENTNGTLSNGAAIHVYLSDLTPETQYTCYILSTSSSAPSNCANSGLPSFLYIKDNTTGWASIPWMDTETNFNGSTYACDTNSYDAADCTGQIVRWQLLQDAAGASTVAWYYWNTTIGNNSSNETAYYYMMQYLEGGKFTAMCSNTTSAAIWTCPFTDTNSNSDLWVWTTNETTQSYTQPSGYINYWIVAGTGAGTCQAIPSSGFTVTVEPYLLVQTSCSVEP